MTVAAATGVALTVRVVTYEDGRRVVRQVRIAHLPAGSLVQRVELLAGDDLLLSLPLVSEDAYDDEEEEDW